MSPPLNPYVAGNPVGNSQAFVGRADILRDTLSALHSPHNIAVLLYGQRRIGKTSIMQQLAAWLPQKLPCQPVYLDLQDKTDWPLGQLLREIVRAVAFTLKQPVPDLGADPSAAFRTIWPTLLAGLPAESSVVLLLDEFDVLADPDAAQAGKAFFPYLSALLADPPPRLKFVFVIGRNVGDLNAIALSLFKSVPNVRVSLLNREDTVRVAQLAEANGSLRWTPEALERVWQLTHGHAFLTQQLCSWVWEQAYEDEVAHPERTLSEAKWKLKDAPPSVTPKMVEAAVAKTLDSSRSSLEWIWKGLPPAAHVVIAALAEGGPGVISQERLEQLLRESGVRVMIRELQNAPHLLQGWDLIEETDGGYRFRVELLRRWLAGQKPLRRVQEELDQIEPVAHNLYQAGLGLYRSGRLDEAIPLLRQAVGLNPSHAQAMLLLADILLAKDEVSEARKLLERLYENQPAAARPRLVDILLKEATNTKSEDQALAIYEHILKLDSTIAEAQKGRQLIQQSKRKQALRVSLKTVEELEKKGKYAEALDIVHQLADEYAEDHDWKSTLERLEHKTRLADLYQRGLGALQAEDKATAQKLLAEVVSIEPTYQQATRYLHLAVTGVDVAELHQKIASLTPKPQTPSAPPVPENENPAKESLPAAPRQLTAWNPLDYLRLLWWMLIMPKKLKAHRDAYGEKAERPVGNWLASTLIWLPLGMPALAVALGLLPLKPDYVWLANRSWGVVVALGIAWCVEAVFGVLINVDDNNAFSVGYFFVSAVVVVIIVATGIVDGMAGSVARGLVPGIQVVVVDAISVGLVGGVAVIVALLVALGVAGSLAGNVARYIALFVELLVVVVAAVVITVGMSGGNGMAVGVAGSMTCCLAAFVLGGIVLTFEKSLKTNVPSLLGWIAFLVLVAVHAFLFWFCFLGGAQLLESLGGSV